MSTKSKWRRCPLAVVPVFLFVLFFSVDSNCNKCCERKQLCPDRQKSVCFSQAGGQETWAENARPTAEEMSQCLRAVAALAGGGPGWVLSTHIATHKHL